MVDSRVLLRTPISATCDSLNCVFFIFQTSEFFMDGLHKTGRNVILDDWESVSGSSKNGIDRMHTDVRCK